MAENISGAEYVARHYLLGVIAVGLLLPVLFGDPGNGLVRRVLSSRILLYLGMIAYGVYLWHFAVLLQLDRWGFDKWRRRPAWIWFLADLAGASLIAT